MSSARAPREHSGEPLHAGRVEDAEALEGQRPPGRLKRSPVRRDGEPVARLACQRLDARVIVTVRIGEPRDAVAELALELLARTGQLGQGCCIGQRRQGSVRHGV